MDRLSPYLPPAMPPPPPPGPREPGAIKVFGVIHLVFAGLGLIMGLWSMASPFVTPMFIPKNDPSYEMQVRMQEEMMGFSIATGVAMLVIAALLLISGLKLVRSQPDGIKWSAIYSWTSIASKLVSLVVTIVWILPLTRTMMREMFQQPDKGPHGKQMLAIMEPMTGIFMVLGPIVSCTYPLLALFLLSRPAVKAWRAQREWEQSQGAA